MKRRATLIILSLVCALFCALGLAACSVTDKQPGHTHEYSQGWTYDNTQHWHECSCGDKKDTAKHTFKDGVCGVCGYIKDVSGSSVAGMTFVFARVEVACDDDKMKDDVEKIKAETEKQMKNDYISFGMSGFCSALSGGSTVNGTYTQDGSVVTMTVGGKSIEITVAGNSIYTVSPSKQGITVTVIYVKGTVENPSSPSTPTVPDTPSLPDAPSLSCEHDSKNLYLIEDYKSPSCIEEGFELRVFVCLNTVDYDGKDVICGAVLRGGMGFYDEIGKIGINSEYDFKRLEESGEIYERLSAYRTTLIKTDHEPVIDPAVPATCSEKGLTQGSHCRVCNATIKAQIETDYADHSYTDAVAYYDTTSKTDSVCRNCGRLETVGYTFKTKLNDDGQSYSVVKGDGWEELNFATITYNGKPITAIGGIEWIDNRAEGQGSFKDCQSLKSVNLSGVTQVGGEAFNRCINLKSVIFGSDLRIIASYAFRYCDINNNLTIPDTVETVGWAAFEHNDNLESVTVPFAGVGSWSVNHCVNYYSSSFFGYIFGDNAEGHNNLPANLKTVTVKSGRINQNAFYGYKNIQNITLGDGVEGIILYNAFKNCSGLTDLTLPAGITSIDNTAFSGCDGLAKITFKGSLADYCKMTDVSGLMLNGKADKKLIIDDSEITNTLVIPYGVTKIPAGAFYNYGLTSIFLPESVTSIGDKAFDGCPIENAELPANAASAIPKAALKSVTVTGRGSINKGAFSGSDNLENITIPFVGTDYSDSSYFHFGAIFGAGFYNANKDFVPASLKTVTVTGGTIRANSFSECSRIKNIKISSGVERIEQNAFSGCSGLEKLQVTDNERYRSAGNCIIETATKTLLVGCKNSIIPSDGSVTSIGSGAFDSCVNLTDIEIPTSVTGIGSGAFTNCNSLQSMSIPFVGANKDGTGKTHFGFIFGAAESAYHERCVPSSLKTVVITGGTAIASHAFSHCRGLENITIGKDVNSIGEDAFSYCSGLNSITVDSDNTVYHSAGNCLIETQSATLILGCKNSVIPSDGSVTIIGSDAFPNCVGLTSITIPDGVTIIYSWAFTGCTGLKSVSIPESVYNIGYRAFSGCNGLASVKIGHVNIHIGNEAFNNCPIESAELPISAIEAIPQNDLKTLIITYGTSIERGALSECNNLKSITIPFVGANKNGTGDTHFGYIFGASDCWKNSDYVPSSLETVIITGGSTIGNNAFFGCDGLTNIEIPDSVTSLEVGALSCGNLRYNTYDNGLYLGNKDNFYLVFVKAKNTDIISCEINSSTRFIHSGAFQGCGSLESIIIPQAVTSIGNAAFDGCSTLTSIEIPQEVTSIGEFVFDGCNSLESITVNSNNLNYCSQDGILYNKAKTEFVHIPRDVKGTVEIPYGITRISGGTTFYGRVNLISITVPKSVTYIESSAFCGCNNLTSMTIPFVGVSRDNSTYSYFGVIFGSDGHYTNDDYVPASLKTVTITDGTQIRKEAFYGCNYLESITIPISLESIGENAFSGCTNLTSITYEGTTSQWDSITKGKNWDESTGSYTIHCNNN